MPTCIQRWNWVVCCVSLLGGCASTTPTMNSPSPQSDSATVRSSDFSSSTPSRDLDIAGPLRGSNQIVEPPDFSLEPSPFAVIAIDALSGDFSKEVEQRLLAVAYELKEDETAKVRLEAYVPAAGSRAMNIAIAQKSLQRVRDALVAHGISSRRILLSNFGEEFDVQRHRNRHWVDVHLVHVGAARHKAVRLGSL